MVRYNNKSKMFKSFNKAAKNFARVKEALPFKRESLIDLTKDKPTSPRRILLQKIMRSEFCFVCYAGKHAELITAKKADYIKWRMRNSKSNPALDEANYYHCEKHTGVFHELVPKCKKFCKHHVPMKIEDP